MATTLKQMSTILHEQDTSLEAFYNKFDGSEESLLGNQFIDEDDIDDDYELESGNGNNEAEEKADVTEIEWKN